MKAIIAATIIGVIMMFMGVMAKNKSSVVTVATTLLLLLLGVTIWDLKAANAADVQSYFNNMLRLDSFGLWFNVLMAGCTLLFVLLTGKEIAKVGNHVGEYFALIAFIMVGIFLLSGYNNMLILFLGIEIVSIPQYILAGSDKRNLKSSEAALKYFLMGSFSTGILLMGITLLYGATGTFDILGFRILQTDSLNPMALAGILFLIVGLGFKVSVAPMHTWTPDVYDGAPTPFTAFMATVVKVGVFVAFLRLFHASFGSVNSHWMMIIAIVCALTLFIGNVTAVFQQSVKRMLAYSSIAQAGFMLFAILSVNATAWQGIIIYAIAYSIATIGMFAVLMKMKDYTYDGFNGLAKKEPLMAFFTAIFLFSLVGIPLTGGFMAKYFVILAAIQTGQVMWLVIFAFIMAAVSAYYYFRVIIAMYFKEGAAELNSEVSGYDKLMLGITCGLVILIGVAPQLFLNA
ncbi:MAG TPA: NADH-quinone oxidoreductase subunit N [Flavipsychrobacter sp.]|nr:NADH-quinone oxidoreductase subunit N [Flavipsychrobacter sp.]